MAGKPGRSGGSRANTGGARPGAGRKPAEPVFLDIDATDDPLIFLSRVMQNDAADMKLRLSAAVALMPFLHSKAELGKKDQAQVAAKKAGSGRFGASKTPMLVISNP